MFFNRKIHPHNFEYGRQLNSHETGVTIIGQSFTAQLQVAELANDWLQLHITTNHVTQPHCSDGVVAQARQLLTTTTAQSSESTPSTTPQSVSFSNPAATKTLLISASSFELRTATTTLKTVPEGFGFHGENLMVNFDVRSALGFYGFGERTKRFNKRGDSLEQWTVDVVATFRHTHDRDDYDPTYVVIPWTIIKFANHYVGIYFDNPGRAVIDVEALNTGQLIYQSWVGATDIYFITGLTLCEIVGRFSELTGRAEIPPLWSLGYHQCRWGYQSEAEFRELQKRFGDYDIPVSAFWYDIDYMDGYRLFTWNPRTFPNPSILNQALKQDGIHTVAIVDPGVKLEAGYAVYERGRQHNGFCKTLAGKEFVGRVWPGDVVFPDFTLATTQQWWANELAEFLTRSALDGAWLDMNDPATGFSDYAAMRFQDGHVPHERYHNQYGHFMAKASYQAFANIAADQRPFLLTRSGFTGTQRYSAIWTGDNVSNWSHLRMSIPSTINLGLSGVAFNGPDIGGFMGHTHAELLIRWYQTGFLFPFFRNHTVRHSKNQEPWQFSEECLVIIRNTIKTRYRLLPYLYQCFSQHYWSGDPVLRPMLYHYDDVRWVDVDDQFLVGENILVAPILYGEGAGREITQQGRKYQQRFVQLPPGWWFDINHAQWLAGEQILAYAAALDEVPLFIRDGSIIPYYNGVLHNSVMDFQQIELHVFIKEQSAHCDYFIDDLHSRSYQRGGYNRALITATVAANELQLTVVESGPLPLNTVQFNPVLYGYQGDYRVLRKTNAQSQMALLHSARRDWLNKSLEVLTIPLSE